MFHPESNPLAPKSSGPKKPEKELVRVWLGDAAAAEMEEKEAETGDEDLSSKRFALTEQEKRKLWERKRPDEVTLKNIPTWKELPNEETFRWEFKFQVIWDLEYREGRPLSEFIPRPKETIPSFQTKEALSHAKVFDIGDVIAKAQEEDHEHPGHLSTKEVLRAIDEAGYRPATLQELVAYARDFWKPDVDPKTLTKEERELPHSQATYIVGLNSVFLNVGGGRYVPFLDWGAGKRLLSARGFENTWREHRRFLVLRKALPS